MRNLKYILIVVILACSVTAYGNSRNSFSIGIDFQPAYQPVYVYQQPVVYTSPQPVVYTSPQPVCVYAQPVYVTPAPVVYAQPEISFGFSTFWGGGGHRYHGGWRGHR